MNAPLLVVEQISHRFGQFQALNNISINFERGKLTAIIGPNGAGKSTFFNVVSGALTPTAGRIVYDGKNITGLPQYAYARLGIAKSFQITTIFNQLSAHENVRVAVQMRRSRFNIFSSRSSMGELHDQADALLLRVGLQDARHKPASELAHGQQRSLEVAMALACTPALLLMDEPTAGMSPEETTAMMDLIQSLAAERTVILVEHKMKLVMGICDRLVVLHHGELLAEGTPEAIRADAEVRRVYLGAGKQ